MARKSCMQSRKLQTGNVCSENPITFSPNLDHLLLKHRVSAKRRTNQLGSDRNWLTRGRLQPPCAVDLTFTLSQGEGTSRCGQGDKRHPSGFCQTVFAQPGPSQVAAEPPCSCVPSPFMRTRARSYNRPQRGQQLRASGRK